MTFGPSQGQLSNTRDGFITAGWSFLFKDSLWLLTITGGDHGREKDSVTEKQTPTKNSNKKKDP